MDDEKDLKEVLKNYHQKVIKDSENVLKDLEKIRQECKEKQFERIHFHYSGKMQNIQKLLSKKLPKQAWLALMSSSNEL